MKMLPYKNGSLSRDGQISSILLSLSIWNLAWGLAFGGSSLIQIQIQIFLFPIKEPFRAEQLTKNLIQWLWIDYIDCKMTTYKKSTTVP